MIVSQYTNHPTEDRRVCFWAIRRTTGEYYISLMRASNVVNNDDLAAIRRTSTQKLPQVLYGERCSFPSSPKTHR